MDRGMNWRLDEGQWREISGGDGDVNRLGPMTYDF